MRGLASTLSISSSSLSPLTSSYHKTLASTVTSFVFLWSSQLLLPQLVGNVISFVVQKSSHHLLPQDIGQYAVASFLLPNSFQVLLVGEFRKYAVTSFVLLPREVGNYAVVRCYSFILFVLGTFLDSSS